MAKAKRVHSTPRRTASKIRSATSQSLHSPGAANCPALALARCIDACARQHTEFEELSFKLKADTGSKTTVENAGDLSQHLGFANLQMLALTPAQSFEGALAKAFIAFGILKCEIETPHDNEWEKDHHVFLAQKMMADARRVFELHFEPIATMGADYWYAQHLEPNALIEKALELAFDDKTVNEVE